MFVEIDLDDDKTVIKKFCYFTYIHGKKTEWRVGAIDPSTHVECKDEPQPITFKLKKLLN